MKVVVGSQPVLVLLSGGIDSAVCATKLVSEGKDVHALTIQYPNHTNAREVENAIFFAQKLNLKHVVLDFNFVNQLIGRERSSMRLNVGGAINNCISRGMISLPMGVELLHMVAVMFARVRNIEQIYWAIHSDDLRDLPPDTFFDYLKALESIPALGDYSAYKFEIPFIGLLKEDVVSLGVSLGVDFDHTRSCSTPGVGDCGICKQCLLRKQAINSVFSGQRLVG